MRRAVDRPARPGAPPTRRRWEATGPAITGWALLVCAAGMAVCAVLDAVADGQRLEGVLAAAAVVGALGAASRRWLVVRPDPEPREVFAAVIFLWIAVSLAGALPYVTTGTLGPLDALFESISGFTCTGSTTIADLSAVDPGLLLWRQLTNWIGGLGLVVLAVSVLPFLGVGGLSLMAAEAPGGGEGKLAPRLSVGARRLLGTYSVLTALAVVGLVAFGASIGDAVMYAMSAVSGGGFAPYADSADHFGSRGAQVVLAVAMVAGATAFVLHWRAAREGPAAYWRSSQFRAMGAILVGTTAVVTAFEVWDGTDAAAALLGGFFTVATLVGACGLVAIGPEGAGDYTLWPGAAQLLLLIPWVSGGMTGSTSGAMKVLRLQVMAQVAGRELRRVVHPRAAAPVVLDGRRVGEDVVARVVGFSVWYFLVGLAGVVLLAVSGVDLVTGIGATLGAMGGSGLGLGQAGPTTTALVFSEEARVVLAVLMLAGRLEIFALVVVVTVAMARAREGLVAVERRLSRAAGRPAGG